jgi:hypothetical protein
MQEMVPINLSKIYNAKGEFDYLTFKKYFLNLCSESREKNKTLVFAFLVYDFKNANISQVIHNSDYWNALNSISSNYIDIFYIDILKSDFNNLKDQVKEEIKEELKQELKIKLLRSDENYVPPNTFQLMRPMASFSNNTFENVKSFVELELRLTEYVKQPCIIFFQISNETITDCFFVELKEELFEQAYLEIKELLKEAVYSVEKVETNNFDRHKEIFELVKIRIKDNKAIRVIKSKIKKNPGILLRILLKIIGN